MSKIEVVKKTVHEVGDINHEYGSLLVGKTECGSFAWSIEANTFEKWEIIPESLYIELMKLVDSMPAKDIDQLAKERASHVVQAIGVIGGEL